MPEAASVGAAVGSSVESARTAAEDAQGGSGAAGRSGGSGGGADGSKGGSSSGAVGRQAHIPHLYAPGELLYLRSAPGVRRASSCSGHDVSWRGDLNGHSAAMPQEDVALSALAARSYGVVVMCKVVGGACSPSGGCPAALPAEAALLCLQPCSTVRHSC